MIRRGNLRLSARRVGGATSSIRVRRNFSVTVLDADQNRGVATLLLAILWLTSLREGISCLIGHVMAENTTAAAWMRRTGANGRWDGYKNTFRWHLEDLDRLPPTRAAAELAGWLAQLAPVLLK